MAERPLKWPGVRGILFRRQRVKLDNEDLFYMVFCDVIPYGL